MFTAKSLRTGLIALASIVPLVGSSSASAYMSYDDYLLQKRLIRRDSDLRLLLVSDPNVRNQIRREEDALIQSLWDEYLAKHGKLALAGNAMINGITGATSMIAESGASATLSFCWINGIAKEPTGGPSISAVLYEVHPDPSNPSLWITLGTSSDAFSNFAFPFVTQGFEPDYRATPLDAAGQPIFVAGVGGSNVAFGSVTVIPDELVPAPGSAVLAGLGGFLFASRRRRG